MRWEWSGTRTWTRKLKKTNFSDFSWTLAWAVSQTSRPKRYSRSIGHSGRAKKRASTPITTCSATCWRKTSKPIPNIRGMEETGSIGRCQVRTVISSSSLLAGGMESIPVISAMTQKIKSVACISILLILKKTTMINLSEK